MVKRKFYVSNSPIPDKIIPDKYLVREEDDSVIQMDSNGNKSKLYDDGDFLDDSSEWYEVSELEAIRRIGRHRNIKSEQRFLQELKDEIKADADAICIQGFRDGREIQEILDNLIELLNNYRVNTIDNLFVDGVPNHVIESAIDTNDSEGFVFRWLIESQRRNELSSDEAEALEMRYFAL